MEHVLAGRWKYGEDYIRNVVKDNTAKIASLKDDVVQFSGFDEKETHIISVDGLNTSTWEFRQDPSPKYFNHKDNGPGVKYELALALRRVSSTIFYVASTTLSLCGELQLWWCALPRLRPKPEA